MAQPEAFADTDDRELLQRVAARDLDALAALYDRYAQPLYALACRILGSTVEAEESIIDLFQLIWQTGGRDDGTAGPVDAWLFALVRKRCLERLKQVKQQGRRLTESCAEANGASVRFQAERQEVIRTALATLPEGQREVLELAYYKGLKDHEIALVADRPAAEVQAQARQGLARLDHLLSHLWGVLGR